MTRTYDEDGQPMMSDKAMLKLIVKEIPVLDRTLRTEIAEVDQKLGKLGKRMEEGFDQMMKEFASLRSETKELHFQMHQNFTSLITNQANLEKRVAVLEGA